MRTLSLRALALLPATALAALTLAACAASARPAPAASSRPDPVACTPAGLRVTAGFSQGAGQHAIYDLRFTNTSPAACTLQGYPGVSLVTAGNPSGRPIGSPRPQLMPSQDPGVTKVTLAPGQHAAALMGIAETVEFTGISCDPVTAHWLKVYPPHASRAVYLPIKAVTCSSSTDQVLEISPVYPDS
jgi:Protein of unknown function (DUF4232)